MNRTHRNKTRVGGSSLPFRNTLLILSLLFAAGTASAMAKKIPQQQTVVDVYGNTYTQTVWVAQPMGYADTGSAVANSPASRAIKRNVVDCDTGLGRSGRTVRRTASDMADITGGYSSNNTSSVNGDMRTVYSWFNKYSAGRPSSGACGKFVRKALAAGGYTPCETPLDNLAKNFGPKLASYGFRNMIGSYPNPAAAPVGSVLVYDPTCKDTKYWYAGHVEVKTPSGYFSDYGSPRARVAESIKQNSNKSGRCRKLTGVWIPPAQPKFRSCFKGP